MSLADPTYRPDLLTRREREVLGELSAGRSNAEIGERLHIGPETVKTHVSRILTKLGVRSRLEAVVVTRDPSIRDREAQR
ncbi:MAG: helix-turn-helix transcriptional regulator [Ilumatobacter sp.]|nr:helix-turn-helix transcriptional regulator [Ilumatobacter sp.]MDJ0767579.1 helix-turn-helix transcriptional regulator [Ilumatobacter sp.]